MNPEEHDINRSALRKRVQSFRYAFRGIGQLFCEPNGRIHLIATAAVVALGFTLKISLLEWCLVVGAIAAVLAAELFNSALERLADRVCSSPDQEIGRVKDIAAGAVLITAIGAAILGLLIFIPKIISFFF